VLFPARSWPGLRAGTVTVAFRRWKRPTVKQGGTLQSPGGLLSIDEVASIEPQDITEADVAAAGFSTRDEVLAALRPEGALYRIRFSRIGDDPRVALREQADLDPGELESLRRKLDRLEWAVPTLQVIAARPAVVSTELAASLGVDRPMFKQRVRRLKSLGLTESLETGYRLSPRGATVLDHIQERDPG
jgi:hypothetical protein